MLRYQEKELNEADDQKIQKMAYELFQYLVTRGLKSGVKIPAYDETVRKAHAERYVDGVSEFIEAIKNYTSGYMRGMMQDEKKYKSDYNSIAYDRVINGLKAYNKYA